MKKKIIIFISCVIILPIVVLGIFYLKSDKFELRNLFNYISNDYKPYFKYNSVSIDKSKKLCVIKFENKIESGDEFVKQTSNVTNMIKKYIDKNPDYILHNYKIELWYNNEACGELFQLRNYDQNNVIHDDFIYLYESMNGLQVKSVAMYYQNVECLAYMNFREDQYPDFKLFKKLRYLDVGFGGYKKYEDKLLKDFPDIIEKYYVID